MVYADDVVLVAFDRPPCSKCGGYHAEETHEVLVQLGAGTLAAVQRGCESCMRELSERLQAGLPNRPASEIPNDDEIPF